MATLRTSSAFSTGASENSLIVGWTSHLELAVVSLKAWIALMISETLVAETCVKTGPPYAFM
jgi:hypothetical protein